MKSMRNTAIALFLAIFPCISFAQNSTTGQTVITGKVVNAKDQPLPNASVAVYDSAMTKVITGSAANTKGYFEVKVNPGSYVVKVTFVSYTSYQQRVQISSGEEVSLGTITMKPATESLNTLYIRAEQSEMTLSFDKRVFNVGKDIVSLGGSALSVLNNVPSIVTDINGNISLRGNSSVTVLINGQSSNMVSDGVAALRSIPASMIKKVEIITNPSAQYSAEGTGGIINIVLKKKQELGFNGNIFVGGGFPANFDLGTNLNYRMGDINLFFNGSIDYRRSPEDGSSFVRLASPDTSYMYHEVNEQTEEEYDANIQFGADFFFTETSKLTARVGFEYENGNNDNSVYYTDYVYEEGAVFEDPDFDSPIKQTIDRKETENSVQKELEFNIQYVNRFNKDKHKLEAEIDFDIQRESEFTNIEARAESGSDPAYPILQRIDSDEEAMDIRADIDYKRPLGEHWRLEMGARSTFDWLDNSYNFEEQRDGNWIEVPAYNNNYEFYDNVNAAYATLGAEFGAFSGQLGLRLENTIRNIELLGTNNRIEQNYAYLFPSIFLNYALNENHSIQVSYSRRLDRPWPRLLLPFTEYSESRSRFVGNPDLKPEFSNSFEAGYLVHWETGSLLTSFYYRHRTGVIERVSLLDDQGFTRRIPINLANEDAYGIEFSANQDFFEGLTLTANANFYTANSKGQYQNQLFESETETFQARLGVRWNIGELWNFQTSASYRAPRETAQGRRDASAEMDMGFSRELFNRQAVVTLSARNLLNSQGFDYTINEDGNPNTDYYAHREFNWATRTITISFQYFFGDTQNKRKRSFGR